MTVWLKHCDLELGLSFQDRFTLLIITITLEITVFIAVLNVCDIVENE